MTFLATLVTRSGQRTDIGYDFQSSLQLLAKRDETDVCIVSTEDGFSPLGASLKFLSSDLGIMTEEIKRLANWNQLDNARVTLVALKSRRSDSRLRGIILAPGETARCYGQFAVPLYGRPFRDFYYNVTYEAIAFACREWGARKLGISHLSACGHFNEDIATCQAEALAHFCDENPDTCPEAFVFCGCCINAEHLNGIQRLNAEGANGSHRTISVSLEDDNLARLIHLSW